MACIRCEEGDALTPNGYCGACLWDVCAEVGEGLTELRLYLKPWDEFGAWCRANGVAS